MSKKQSRKKWYVDMEGTKEGPFTSSEIREKVRNGEVAAHHLLWKEGLSQWMLAGDFRKLFIVVERQRVTGPSLPLLVLAAISGIAAIVCSPWSELTQSLSDSVRTVLTAVSVFFVMSAVTAAVFGFVGSMKPAVKVAVGAGSVPLEAESRKEIGPEGRGDHVVATASVMGDGVVKVLQEHAYDAGNRKKPLRAVRSKSGIVLACGFILAISGFLAARVVRPSVRITSRYSVRNLGGSVLYDDGTTLRGVPLMVRFTEVGTAVESATAPPGIAMLDPSTGRFQAKMVYATASSATAARLRVTVRTQTGQVAPATVIPEEYSDPVRTPIEVDASKLPLTIVVKRPNAVP